MPVIELLEPHKQQFKFISSKAKFRAFIGGLGSGKTMIGCSEMIIYALANPGSFNAVIAPTYPMMRDVTRKTFFELCPQELIKEFRKGDNTVVFKNGSEILFRSCDDPEKLRGPNLASFYGDEASLWPHMAWKILIGRIRQAGFKPKAWITATPKGFNWIYEEFVEKKREEYELIHCSSEENPYLPKDYIQSLKDSYTGVFAKQEIYGEFVAPEGLVYMNFNRRIHVTDCQSKEFKDVFYGIDWGYTNPSVILAIGIDADNRIHVIDEFCQSRVMIEDLITIAKQFQNRHGQGAFYADLWG